MNIYISHELFAEYEEVLVRPRLKISLAALEQLFNWYRTNARWVEPAETAIGCSDPDDDMVLACAHECRADFLVTGNSRHFPDRWHDTLIVTPRQFIDAIQVEPHA